MGGCSTAQPITYLGHSDLQYYKGLATKIDYPNRPDPDNPVAFASQEPRRIRHRQHDQIWDFTLNDAIHIALKNNKVIRYREQASFPRNPLVNNPEQNPSVYDPALQETGFLFGQRGVEAALSDFDAQFSASMMWGHNAQIENNQSTTAVPLVNGIPTLIEDTATFKSALNKQFADSGSLTFSQEWDYVANNVTGNLFPSVYTGFVRGIPPAAACRCGYGLHADRRPDRQEHAGRGPGRRHLADQQRHRGRRLRGDRAPVAARRAHHVLGPLAGLPPVRHRKIQL